MFKLRRVRSLNIRQRSIRLHDPVRDETVHLPCISMDRLPQCQSRDTHAGQIPLQAKSVKITTAEHQRAKILSDRRVQTFGRGEG